MIRDVQVTEQRTFCDYCGKEGIPWYMDQIGDKHFHRHSGEIVTNKWGYRIEVCIYYYITGELDKLLK